MLDVEFLDIVKFLSKYAPFKDLSDDTLRYIAQNIEISYYRKDSFIIEFGDFINEMFLIRTGAVEVYQRNGQLYNRLEIGKVFGHMALLTHSKSRFPAKAIDDSLIYCIPEKVFQHLYNNFDSFADFVEIDDSARLRQAILDNSENKFTTAKIGQLLRKKVPVVNKDISILKAAQIMQTDNYTALLVVDTNSDKQDITDEVIGIITDRDFCTKVVAGKVDTQNLVTEIMHQEIYSLDYNSYVYEAMLLMLRHNVRHLPIYKAGKPVGIIEANNIVRYQSQSSILLVNGIFKKRFVFELENLSEQLKYSFVRMVDEDANSHMIGTAMSVIGRSFIQRLIELAEEKFGKPPIAYCFFVLGSMGRDEQLLVTDQDNALILDNSYNEELHGEYFANLAKFVSDGLSKCQYKYCKGDIMATNSQLRLTRLQWEECFAEWIDDPNPQALLNASIFFDLVGVHGQIKWAEQLTTFITRRAKRNKLFLSCLAHNALKRKPPLGFFKNFVLEKDGQHKNSMDLKRRGTAPLADLIRVHALAVGSHSQNSFERLDDIEEANYLPKEMTQDLRDALEFISMVRIRHQALDVKNEVEPDNNIEPENLSVFERRNLKYAFLILSNAQNFLKFKYTRN